jgi:hypothetical protein
MHTNPQGATHMMIKLTFATKARDEFWMRTTDIKSVQKDPNNLIQTLVVTNIVTPQGYQTFAVLEPMDEIAAQVNNALRGGQLQ